MNEIAFMRGYMRKMSADGAIPSAETKGPANPGLWQNFKTGAGVIGNEAKDFIQHPIVKTTEKALNSVLPGGIAGTGVMVGGVALLGGLLGGKAGGGSGSDTLSKYLASIAKNQPWFTNSKGFGYVK